MDKYFVTGGSGFLGSYVIENLSKKELILSTMTKLNQINILKILLKVILEIMKKLNYHLKDALR